MKVVLLTNFIAPYRLPLYQELSKKIKDFSILISTPMEKNRDWKTEWGNLNVIVQKNITITKKQKHPHGFIEKLFIHIPYDTVFLLNKIKPDIIISSEMGLRTIFALIYHIFNNKKTKFILWATLSEYSELGRGFLRNIIRKIIIPECDAILVNGNSGKRYIKKYNFPDEKIFFAPYTTEINRFLELPLQKSEDIQYKLLYIGQLIERKGILLFLDCLNQYAYKHKNLNIVFEIAGEGELKEKIKSYNFSENLKIIFDGFIEYEQIHKIYQNSGIFVFPTLSDEWGLVTNEALAGGLPVLGSIYAQSVEELIEDKKNGWIFKPDDFNSMFDAIDNMFKTDINTLQKMREYCREKIKKLDIEYVANNIIKSIDYLKPGFFIFWLFFSMGFFIFYQV